MICQQCGQKEASFEWSQQVNGKKAKVRLCGDCALVLGLFPGVMPGSSLFAYPALVRDQRGRRELVCPSCGETETELREKGLLGCSHCYETFMELLIPVFSRSQGNTRHLKIEKTYKAPRADLDPDSAEGLKQALEEAVRKEAYEEAARLRDRIRMLEEHPPEEFENEEGSE